MNKILHWLCSGWGGITIGVFAGTMIGSGGNLLGISAQKFEIIEPAEEVQSAEVMSVNEAEEKPSEVVENSVEKPAKNEEKSWEKPAVSESKIVPKTETVKPQTVTTPTIPKTETANNNEFSIYGYSDYEETILGTCPSERDQSNSWERGSRMAALRTEIDRSPWTRLTLNQLIESWWDDYRQGKWTGKHMMASLNHIEGFDDNYSNSLVAMYIDFDGFFVTWDNSWQDGKSMNVSTEQGNYLNKVQSDGTLYLRSLESRYNAKCPND